MESIARNEVFLLWLLMLPPLNGADTMPSVCGQPVLTPRIVGGQTARMGAWPWQVSISQRGRHFCGGSLVAEQWVLSAAHCFSKDHRSDITVTLGEYELQKPSRNAETIRISKIILNAAFSGVGTPGDIALLWLQRPLKYTAYILPVCVPESSAHFPEGMGCWVTGWGRIDSSVPLPYPQTLQEVKVPLLTNKKCNELYNTNQNSTRSKVILDDMICAGYEDGKKDSCQGDSGGPLVCAQNNSWFLVGIVSWGDGCAKRYRPGVYTRVTSYSDWLQNDIPGLQLGIVPINSFCVFSGSWLLICSIFLLLFSS